MLIEELPCRRRSGRNFLINEIIALTRNGEMSRHLAQHRSRDDRNENRRRRVAM